MSYTVDWREAYSSLENSAWNSFEVYNQSSFSEDSGEVAEEIAEELGGNYRQKIGAVLSGFTRLNIMPVRHITVQEDKLIAETSEAQDLLEEKIEE